MFGQQLYFGNRGPPGAAQPDPPPPRRSATDHEARPPRRRPKVPGHVQQWLRDSPGSHAACFSGFDGPLHGAGRREGERPRASSAQHSHMPSSIGHTTDEADDVVRHATGELRGKRTLRLVGADMKVDIFDQHPDVHIGAALDTGLPTDHRRPPRPFQDPIHNASRGWNFLGHDDDYLDEAADRTGNNHHIGAAHLPCSQEGPGPTTPLAMTHHSTTPRRLATDPSRDGHRHTTTTISTSTTQPLPARTDDALHQKHRE